MKDRSVVVHQNIILSISDIKEQTECLERLA